LERIVELNRILVIQAGISFLLTCLLVVFFHLGLLGALIAAILASISGTAGFAFLLKGNWARFIPHWHSDVIKASLSFGLRGYIANILQFFNYRLDVLIVNFFLGPTAVGIYAVSYGIAELIWNLPDAVSFVFFPRTVSDQRQKRKSTTLQILAITVVMTLIGALFLATVGKFLISFLYTDTYKGAYLPLLALLPGVVLLGAAKVLTAEILGRGYPQYNSILSGVGLIVTVIGDLILIPGYGILGAAIASSLSYGVIFLISIGFYLYVKRRDLLVQGIYN
jgi:O-antigen/teichoic acid export membrane protein